MPTALLIAFAMIASACQRTEQADWRKFTATAYSVSGTTKSGKTTREGRTIAADPSVLPLGTRVEIRGAGSDYNGVYVVQDTGPAVKGARVDIFIDDRAKAKEFGRKRVEVRVIELPEDEQASR